MSAAASPIIKARRAHIWALDPHGHYVEPQWSSTRLFEVEWFGPPGTVVFDPACGWGRILKAAIAAGFTPFGADIVDRLQRHKVGRIDFQVRNFLQRPPHDSVEVIVCNPPFDRVREFCELAVDVVTVKAAMLVPLRRLPAAHWLECLPLQTIYLLTPRPSMPPGFYLAAGNKASGGSRDFCWLVFHKAQKTAESPRLYWLHRDGASS
jgi:hypothetical protein